MNNLFEKLGLAGTSSIIAVESAGLDQLKSTLITIACSVLSVFAVEGLNWLRSHFNKKRVKNEKEIEKIQKED